MSSYAKFLLGACNDGRNRHVSSLIERSDEAIETDCSALQWLFPIHTASPVEPGAWLLTAADIYEVQRSSVARAMHSLAVARMRNFYGDTTSWRVAHDHNHKRITRIITNIGLCIDRKEAFDFYRYIYEIHLDEGRPVNDMSLAHWREAARA